MAGETVKDLVVLPLHVKFLRGFMLFSLLFAPLSHVGIPGFALLQFCIPSLNQKCCQQLALVLLVSKVQLQEQIPYQHPVLAGLVLDILKHMRNRGWPAAI